MESSADGRAPSSVVPLRVLPPFPIHDGRRILVTGAAHGIGAAVATRLVAEGAAVALVDIDGDGVGALAQRLGRAIAVTGDVGDLARVPEVVDACADRLGGLDGVVSNAGIVRIRPAVEHTVDDWTTQLAVNLIGSFEVARAAVPHLRAAAAGAHVVFVSSESGKRGHVDMVAYNASKAAQINMTRVLAEEWAPFDVNVNAVCPGGVATPMLHDVADHYADGDAARARDIFSAMTVPRLGRHVDPDEVARVVSFLLSPAAQAVRGQSINVDGGESPY